ncbi:hypothetical protein DL89DRAFT_261616 [Linderina pennispora]|uniref:Uncharacterized protein n=1 Tax=Linderina pennispora TaxID=61395 RepID=A0A1Y1VUR6_9FUNG|nr:uncharacterized protein DL89DRAFT_261616 [Linderina pennispora]ORX65038.1 hypothetical protein DL89DRAFT_261616 [Linderina pennispora]
MVLPTIRELETIRISLGTGAASSIAEAPAATTTSTHNNSSLHRNSDCPRPTAGRCRGSGSAKHVEAWPAARAGLWWCTCNPIDTSWRLQAPSTRSTADLALFTHPMGNQALASASAESANSDKPMGILTKYKGELQDVTDKCNVLAQFASPVRPERNKFNAQPSDDLVIDMARKAYEVLMVFMTIRRERMSTSVDDDTMEYIRQTSHCAFTCTVKRPRKRSVSSAPRACLLLLLLFSFWADMSFASAGQGIGLYIFLHRLCQYENIAHM